MRSEKVKSCISYQIESATAGVNLFVPFQGTLRPEESQKQKEEKNQIESEE